MRILFNDFKKQYKRSESAINQAAKRVFESGYYILGPEVKSFEQKFASYLETQHVIGVANGLDALHISLRAAGIGAGDEVITTSLSAVATALAIESSGATVVFADIDTYYHLDPSDIEKKITKKTKAIIPVHLYGQPVDMKTITSVAKKHNLIIIEDCAQAHGAEFQGKKVGTFGTVAAFSFYPTKNLGAIGDGGCIVTNDTHIAEQSRMIRNYGQKNRYEHEIYGVNSRLDELQAAILSEKLINLDAENSRRQEIADMYKSRLANLPFLTLPKDRANSRSVHHLFVIQTSQRDALQAFLKDAGIDTLVHYPIPIHKQKCFSAYNNLSLPMTEEVSRTVLSLPIHPCLSDEEVAYVCEKIQSFYTKSPTA